MLCDVTFDDDLSNHLLSCAEPTFQSGSLKRPGSSRQLPSNLRILQNPLSSGFNPEGIYVWHYMPLGEDLTRYPGQDTLFFCSANDQWKKLFGFCYFVKPPFCFFVFFLQHTTWSHTLCTEEAEELSRFISGNGEVAVTHLERKTKWRSLPLQKHLGKYYSMYRRK